ncbi:conserved hypothetical protein [Desulfamplus magnetovallimortis]|uniref:Uncharacterized protein n=1 Tax=Desulfamplus magnetovallimortis TaxID=1246637 RepID=A0A1W1HL80_9BACT|nr:hypothetical protein [Desulfamplus magnetovallimortis]SLM33257.1 conserved hypothetical protein [Desulfamplus magnetovallimortis]
MKNDIIRKVLVTSSEFKKFWKQHGPFRYALTSAEYPPVMIEPEEWIFSDNIISLVKALMQWDERKMKIVHAPFNRKKRNVLKPELLVPWKINNFPIEWECAVCKSFTPVGHLTESVLEIAEAMKVDDSSIFSGSNGDVQRDGAEFDVDEKRIEKAFFASIEKELPTIGYVLLKPDHIRGAVDHAYINDYMEEWVADEKDAF